MAEVASFGCSRLNSPQFRLCRLLLQLTEVSGECLPYINRMYCLDPTSFLDDQETKEALPKHRTHLPKKLPNRKAHERSEPHHKLM